MVMASADVNDQIWDVQVKGSWIAVWLFDQGLVMPDPDSVDSGQICDVLAESGLHQ